MPWSVAATMRGFRPGCRWRRQSGASTLTRCRALSTVQAAPRAPLTGILRDYQIQVLSEVRKLVREGERQILCPLATGLGKTTIFANLPKTLRLDLKRPGTLVLVHRDELVVQAVEAFRRWAPGAVVAIEKGDQVVHDLESTDVIVASVQSLGRKGSSGRLARFAKWKPGLLIVDEAHHVSPKSSYDLILTALGIQKKRPVRQTRFRAAKQAPPPDPEAPALVGFTATPFRFDGKLLSEFFCDKWTTSLDLAWGIRNGYTVDIMAYQVKTVTNLEGVKVRMGDLGQKDLSRCINHDERNTAIAKAVKDHGGQQAIVYCASVEHAAAVAEKLCQHEIRAAMVHGMLDKTTRRDMLERFRQGELSALVNVGVLTEGFDAPMCDTVVMCRPTLSPGLYLQMLGRGTRPWPPPPPTCKTPTERVECIRSSRKPFMRLIDFVDNAGKHQVVTLSTLLGLYAGFDLRGGSLLTLVDMLEQVPASDRDEMLSQLSEAKTSMENLLLRIKQFRLLDQADRRFRQRHDEVRAARVDQLKKGDKIGMKRPKTHSNGDQPQHYVVHAVRVVGFAPVRGSTRVKVLLVDGAGQRFSWTTSRVMDAQKEEVHEGGEYLMAGVVEDVTQEREHMVASLSRPMLFSIGWGSNLWELHGKVLRGKMDPSDWEKKVSAFLARHRGGYKTEDFAGAAPAKVEAHGLLMRKTPTSSSVSQRQHASGHNVKEEVASSR